MSAVGLEFDGQLDPSASDRGVGDVQLPLRRSPQMREAPWVQPLTCPVPVDRHDIARGDCLHEAGAVHPATDPLHPRRRESQLPCSKGVPWTRQLSRLRWRGAVATFLDLITPTGATFNGHNASVWTKDLHLVNGFDERLQWGGLDREIGERLTNAGIPGRQFRHRAIVVHLDHARGYKTAEAIAKNRAIRDEVAKKRLTRAAVGLDQYTTG
jgi:hypothetical protein